MALPKLLQELEGKLSTSGGTMTGELTAPALRITSGNTVVGSIKGFLGNYAGLTVYGNQGLDDAWLEGAYVFLRSANAELVSDRGKFGLVASLNSSKSVSLIGTPDGTLTWGGKPVLCGESGGFPVGFIALYAGSNVPDGWFRCDGSTIANMATNYPKLYAVLGTNVLPNYLGRVPLGASSGINTAVEAGLPGAVGSVGFRPMKPNTFDPLLSPTGVFSAAQGEAAGNSNVETSGYIAGSKDWRLQLDLSVASPLYGKSTTVQPPAVKVAVLIKHD